MFVDRRSCAGVPRDTAFQERLPDCNLTHLSFEAGGVLLCRYSFFTREAGDFSR
jgi:hypothetical protein